MKNPATRVGDSKELWFTPSDYAASWFVRVTGDQIEILKKQDIWPGYDGAKELPFEQGELESYRERILWKAAHGYDGWPSTGV